MHIFPFAEAAEKQNILAYKSQGKKVIIKCKDAPYSNSKEIELAKGLAWAQTKQDYDNINGLSRLIHVAVDCNYAISSNVDTEDGLTNSAIFIMRYIDYHNTPTHYHNTPTHEVPSILWVEFTDSAVSHKTWKERKYLYFPDISPSWTPICSNATQKSVLNCKILREQFPLVSPAAVTIHKCQGSTLSNVCIDIDLSESPTRKIPRKLNLSSNMHIMLPQVE